MAGLVPIDNNANFFQGRHQFYSYVATESPTSRFFPVKGMKLDVGVIFSKSVNNLSFFKACKSKTNQLFLTSVSWRLTGDKEYNLSKREEPN